MSVVDKIRATNGIVNYLQKFDIGKPRNKSHRAYDEHINSVLIKYCKEFKIKYVKNNSPKYKGSYQPVVDNAYTVQSNFKQFAEWVKSNYGSRNRLRSKKHRWELNEWRYDADVFDG